MSEIFYPLAVQSQLVESELKSERSYGEPEIKSAFFIWKDHAAKSLSPQNN